MTYLTGHWSFDPFGILALAVAAWHEIGLRRLARRSRPDRTRQRRIRSLWFYAGLGVLLLAVESPIDYWADDYFFAHMIQHLLLMFAAPSLIVAGAPWQPLLAALPRRTGRSVTRGVLAAGWSRPLRGLGALLLRPWVSVAVFNAAMLLWHLPGPFDLAEENQAVHIWLMHGTMFGTGVLFWLQIIPSPPFRQRMPLLSQAGALLGTNVVMIGIAMTLSIFAQGSVYSVYDHIPGITLPAFADQQIGAAILWVCGDFWALPSMIVIVRRMVATEGSMSAAVDKILSRGPARPGSWGWGRPGALAELRAQPPSSPEAGSLNGRRGSGAGSSRGPAPAAGSGRRPLRSSRRCVLGSSGRRAKRSGCSWRCVKPSTCAVSGVITSVILCRPLKADDRATSTTPMISAAMPPASIASIPGVTWIRSPNTTMPSAMPATGSPAAMVGSEACSGPALNAFCISHRPTIPAASRQYGGQLVNSTVSGCPCRISSVCLVSASWMPNTRPAARPVRLARAGPRVLSPICTATYAMPAMIAATNQCENEPNDRPMGLVDRDSDNRATPAHRISAPATSVQRIACFAIGTASSSANSR